MSLFGLVSGKDLRKRLDDVTNSQKELSARVRAMELEWELSYEKIKTGLARLNKRARDAERAAPDEESQPAVGDEFTKRILARRRRA